MSWELKRLGDVAQVVRGVTYQKPALLPQGHPDGIPLLRATNVQDRYVDYEEPVTVPRSLVKDSQVLQPGDILIASSSGSESVVGKSAKVVESTPATFGAFCTLLRATSIDPDFLAYFVSSTALRQRWRASARGSNINNLKVSEIAQTEVPVPPLDEQIRIVAQLEDQLGKLEAVRADVAASNQLLQDLRASSISQVFESVGADAEIRIVELGNVAEVLGGTTPKGISSHLGSEMSDQSRIPFFKVGDMNSHPSIMSESRNYLSETAVRTLGMRLVPAGSIVFPKAGGAIATNKKRSLGIEGVLDLNCMAVVPGPELNSEYLHIWFQNKNLTSFSNGSVLPQIGRKTVAAARIPLPRIDIQIEVVRRISETEAGLSVVEKNLVGALARVESARSSVLHRAFLAPEEAL